MLLKIHYNVQEALLPCQEEPYSAGITVLLQPTEALRRQHPDYLHWLYTAPLTQKGMKGHTPQTKY